MGDWGIRHPDLFYMYVKKKMLRTLTVTVYPCSWRVMMVCWSPVPFFYLSQRYICVKSSLTLLDRLQYTLKSSTTFGIRFGKTNDRACILNLQIHQNLVADINLSCFTHASFAQKHNSRSAYLPSANITFYWSVTRMVPLWKNLTHLSIHEFVTSVITIIWLKLLQQGGNMYNRKTLLLFHAGEYFYNFIFSLKDSFVIYLWYFILMFQVFLFSDCVRHVLNHR